MASVYSPFPGISYFTSKRSFSFPSVDASINLTDITVSPTSGTLVVVGSSATCYTSTNHGLHWKEYPIGSSKI